MPKFFVDFEFTGHIKVKAENREKAVEVVENMDVDTLRNSIQNFNVGKYYVEKVKK